MTLLYADARFQQHVTGSHPEHPRRLVAIEAHLEARGLFRQTTPGVVRLATAHELERVHDPPYLDELQRYAAAGGGRIEADTVVCPRSFEVARLAAGAVCDAVAQVLTGPHRTALCLVRPPGHHARPHDAMGFCLLNNVAIGAKAALETHGLARVLIVDWDVHHGNGTQEVFWEDGRVGFLSIHRWPFYPGSGGEDEVGAGPARGMICNIPIAYGTPVEEYHARFEEKLAELAQRVAPELILISAGFDAHREDPIGSLDLEVEDFRRLSQTVLAVAIQYAGGKVVSVLEGGYHPQRLAECVGVHLETLVAADAPRKAEG
jgi:acetoin utilization deacetylase AcuC-like enzyme